MLKIGTKTKLAPEEVTKRAKEFFGPGGYGLEVVEETPTAACFEGSGSRVELIACSEEKGASADLVSQEWDYQVKEFVKKIR